MARAKLRRLRDSVEGDLDMVVFFAPKRAAAPEVLATSGLAENLARLHGPAVAGCWPQFNDLLPVLDNAPSPVPTTASNSEGSPTPSSRAWAFHMVPGPDPSEASSAVSGPASPTPDPLPDELLMADPNVFEQLVDPHLLATLLAQP